MSGESMLVFVQFNFATADWENCRLHFTNLTYPERHNPDPGNPERHNPDPGNPERHNPDPKETDKDPSGNPPAAAPTSDETADTVIQNDS